MKPRIVPSILVPNRAELILRIDALNGLAPITQLDVLDGSFVPEVSFFDPKVIGELVPRFEAEVHLMVRDIVSKVKEFYRPWVKRIYFHYEAAEDVLNTIKALRSLGKEVGMALNPETPVEKVGKFLPELDAVLVMSVNPGKNGGVFISNSLDKIRAIRKLSKHVLLEVDGGINKGNIKDCVQAGADLLVVGSGIRNQSAKMDLDSLSKSL